MVRDKIFGEEIKKQETASHTFVKTIYQSLNPGTYQRLAGRSFREAFDYLLTIIFFLVFIMFIVSIYRFAQVQYGLETEMEKFDSLRLTADFQLSEPIVFGKNDFVIDNKRNYSGEDLLITQEGIYRKPLLCILLKPACILDSEPVESKASDLSDALGYKTAIMDYSLLLMILLIPGLLLVFLVFYVIKFIAIITAAALLAFLVTRLARFEIGVKELYMAAIYSSTVMVLLEIVNMYFLSFYLIPLVAYVILYTICIMMIGERKHIYKKDQ